MGPGHLADAIAAERLCKDYVHEIVGLIAGLGTLAESFRK